MNEKKHNVLITGGGSGLGRGLSVRLARQGHTVHVTDIHLESATETVAEIAAAGGSAAAHALDVTRDADVAALIARLGEGRAIDVLINNAGVQHVARLDEFPIDRWDLLMDVMLRGAFLMTLRPAPRHARAGLVGSFISDPSTR